MVCHSHGSLRLYREACPALIDGVGTVFSPKERQAQFHKVMAEAVSANDGSVLHRFVQTRWTELTGTLDKLSKCIEDAKDCLDLARQEEVGRKAKEKEKSQAGKKKK